MNNHKQACELGESALSDALEKIDDVDEEAKANDSKTESGPAILIDSGRLEDEEANLKTAAQR